MGSRAGRNDKIGAAVALSVTTEAEMDTTGLVNSDLGHADSYPMRLEIEAVGGAIYIVQGATGVSLDTTALDNARVPDEGYREVNVEGAAEAFFSCESVDGPAVVVRAVRLDVVKS